MNVLLVSQCQKRALVETRRILDQYAERRGMRTWQTPITAQGLKTLHRVLKKTARRNTAVACHWIRGKNHSELMWIVGNASRFNEEGAVPTNTTQRDVLRTQDENDWRSAYDIRLLCELAALFHDFGKANAAFIKKLSGGKAVADAYRHEWVSLRMFEAFVGTRSDEQWLEELVSGEMREDWISEIVRDDIVTAPSSPFGKKGLPPLAKMIGWLLVSHHRMPTRSWDTKIKTISVGKLKVLPALILSDWNSARPESSTKDKAACWTFTKGSPMSSLHWRTKARKVAEAILKRDLQSTNWLANPYVVHLSRLSLMLADHYYSSQPADPRLGDNDFSIYANTDRKTRKMKQKLDEHLIGVALHSAKIARTLPNLDKFLPRIARHNAFKKRTTIARFRWQDKAFDLATSLQERTVKQGFFGVNMASTGCGKTLANGRIMYGLADPKQGARFSIALGLRTLTLQTGQAYRERLSLSDDDLAILVGGAAVRELFKLASKDTQSKESSNALAGSESADSLFPDGDHVHFEGALPEGTLRNHLSNSPDSQKLLAAPILVSTIDHLMPAVEGIRGGKQCVPMLRLLTSDLVLDEPDDFGIEDLPALTRLVHWSAMLGGRILLSSATLPPALLQGLFAAYLDGRRIYQMNRGMPGQGVSVWCAWFDEYNCESKEFSDDSRFAEHHKQFTTKRSEKLSECMKRRIAIVHPLEGKGLANDKPAIRSYIASQFQSLAKGLHQQHHSIDPVSNKRVSFGLIRMANIDALIDVAIAFVGKDAPQGHRIHLCCYHSRHPLLVRSRIERHLDQVLNRSDENSIFLNNLALRKSLDSGPEIDQIFIVLASPVAEVGRDHDYDWAIVEPSSMRSIIQLAGRIRRHRIGACTSPNLVLLDTNIKHLEGKKDAYSQPGFEDTELTFGLDSHWIHDLLTAEQLDQIDSRPRIITRNNFSPRMNLVDLEHERLSALMLGSTSKKVPCVNRWWTTNASLSGELQRLTPFRYDPQGSEPYLLIQDEDDEQPRLYQRNGDGDLVPCTNLMQESAIEMGAQVVPWGTTSFRHALEELAEELHISPIACSRRYGSISLPKDNEQGWLYNQHLGFRRSL